MKKPISTKGAMRPMAAVDEPSEASGTSPSNQPRYELPIGQVRRTDYLAVAWLAVVAFCILWQPVELGFFVDDWPGLATAAKTTPPFSAERFAYLRAADPSRPVEIPVRFLFSSLLSDRPFLWQLTLLLLNLGIAAGLSRFIRELTSDEPGKKTATYAAAACWLILPWSVGFRFWPILLPLHVFLLMYVLLLGWLIHSWKFGRGPILVPAVVYLCCCLGYEAFYFQFLAVGAIGLWMVFARRRAQFTVVAKSIAAMTLAQVLAASWWRYTQTTSGVRRGIAPEWFNNIAGFAKNLVPELARSTHESWKLLFGAAALLIVAALILLLQQSKTKARSEAQSVAAGAIVCCFAMALSLVPYALGQRQMYGLGLETRIFTFFSLWFVVFVGLWSVYFDRYATGLMRLAVIVAGCGAASGLVAGQMSRGNDWANDWRLQLRILQEAPIERMMAMEQKATVLSVISAGFGVEGYDLSHAMKGRYPGLATHEFVVFNKWLGPISWDGVNLSYGATIRASPSALYVWVPEWNTFRRANRPFIVNQDLTIVPTP